MASAELQNFLESFPLYKKQQITDDFFHPLQWHGLKFQFECGNEKGERTFLMINEPENALNDATLRSEYFVGSNKRLNYVTHVSGVCQSCSQFKVHFLLQLYSEGEVIVSRHRGTFAPGQLRSYADSHNNRVYNPQFFVKKIGQLPAFSIKPDREITDFFNEEDKQLYNKALICLSQSFGIAAYSYFRRIVETEVIRIVDFLISLELPDKKQIEDAYAAYNANHQMDPFLSKIDTYLPTELKSIHPSPLRLLYTELSLGIHSYEEDICLQNAEDSNELLIHIIKALNTKKKSKGLSARFRHLGRK